MAGLADQIVKALGINPDQLREALNRVVGTAQRVDTNMIAAQLAVKQATDHFDARLERIENAIARIADDPANNSLPNSLQVGSLKLNGASQHDVRHIEPEPAAGLANLPGDNGAD